MVKWPSPALIVLALMLLPIAASAQSTSTRVSKAEVLSSDLFPGTSDAQRVYTANIATCREMIEDNIGLRFKWELTSAFQDESLLYALKVEGPTQNCDTSSASEENAEDCTIIRSDRSIGSLDEFTFEIEARRIFGFSDADQCEGRKENYDVTFVLPYVGSGGGGSEGKTHEPDALRLRLETQRPIAPNNVKITPGGSSIHVKWDEVSDSMDYVVYVSTSPMSAGDAPETLENARRHVVSAGNSLRITSGIEPEQDYYVAVSARDTTENESLLSTIATVTTEHTIDFWEDYLNHGGSERGGYCRSMPASEGGWLAAILAIGLLWRRSARRRVGCDA